ncbi:hypothetical protein LCGC14_0616870 [marine sediment metagenome]|uniref:Uncharacterized protein n=1 Tax=marine sediment metagenome TaxID=412755 RepID=A0A0F9R632_9ZZZZ
MTLYELECYKDADGCFVCTEPMFDRFKDRETLSLNYQGRQMSIGRYLYWMEYHEHPLGRMVRKCGNHKCINLDHFEECGANSSGTISLCVGCFNMIMRKGWKQAYCSALELNNGQSIDIEELFEDGGLIKPWCRCFEPMGETKGIVLEEMKQNLLEVC